MINLETITIYLKKRNIPTSELEALRAEITQKLELLPGDEVYFRYESKTGILESKGHGAKSRKP